MAYPLKVITHDGNIETIKLELPATIEERYSSICIFCADGKEYFFKKKDGIYDGYGISVKGEGIAEDQIEELINKTDSEREIEPRVPLMNN